MKVRKSGYGMMAFLAAVVFLQLMCGTASAAAVNPKLVLEKYNLSETPAMPGHEITLTLHLSNIHTNCASTVSVQLSASYPVHVEGSDMQYLGTICPGDDENGTAVFKLAVDPLAMTGTYPIAVLTAYEKDLDKFSESNTINMRVGGAPSFAVSVASSNPVDVYPGDEAAVTLKFQNNGASQAEATRVKLTAPEGLEVKWAGSEQQLGPVPPRSSASATFFIEAAKSTEAGTYMLNATLDYSSEDGTPAHESFLIGMVVSKRAEFAANTDKNSPFFSGDDRSITVTLKNTGSEEARNLKVRIMPIFPFSTDGTVRYVDFLMPGEEKDLVYVVHIDKDGTAGGQAAGLIIDFEDPQGKKFTDSIDLLLKVSDKDAVYYIMIYWPLIVLAVIAVLAFRKRKEILQKIAKRRAKAKK